MSACPGGFQLYQNTCYGPCPLYMEPANEDPSKCAASATCPTFCNNCDSLMNDNVFSLVCNKIGQAKEITCPEGFTEWQTGTCFINCPSGLMENGLTCLKRPINRQFVLPGCSMFYLYTGTECTLNPIVLFFVVCLAAAFLYFAFVASSKLSAELNYRKKYLYTK